MLIRTFVLKVIDNERNILNRHNIVNCISENVVSVIAQVCKETKLRIHSNLRRPNFSFTYSFKFTYFCIVDIWTLEKNFVKESKKPSLTAIKTTYIIMHIITNIITKIY